VIGATTVIATASDEDPFDRPALHQMIIAELTRLATVLDTDGGERLGEFDLFEALRPVLSMHSLASSNLHCDVGQVRVFGRPNASATALDNVLRNALTHTSGAAVHVFTVVNADVVDLVVDDSGPGIPRPERGLVLQPGVRGSGAVGPGSGLGLGNARTIMEAQAGAIALDDAPAGGLRVVLSFRLVSCSAPVAC
jgi:signal transduction histidine kinase